jgi:hypothetical protein
MRRGAMNGVEPSLLVLFAIATVVSMTVAMVAI